MTTQERIDKMLKKSEAILNAGKQTNAEWLRQASDEELAEVLRRLTVDAFDDCRKNNEYWIYKDNWVEWLKEKHTE